MQRFMFARIWPVIAGSPPTSAGSTAISTVAAQGTTDGLLFLADSLATCENFVLDRPALVTEIIDSLSRHPADIHDRVRGALLTSGIPFGTSRTPGKPAQRNVDNRDRAETLSHDESLPEPVRELYGELRTALQHLIDRDLMADLREAEA